MGKYDHGSLLGNYFQAFGKSSFSHIHPLGSSTTRMYMKSPSDEAVLSHPGFKYKAHVRHRVSKTTEERVCMCAHARTCTRERAGTWVFWTAIDEWNVLSPLIPQYSKASCNTLPQEWKTDLVTQMNEWMNETSEICLWLLHSPHFTAPDSLLKLPSQSGLSNHISSVSTEKHSKKRTLTSVLPSTGLSHRSGQHCKQETWCL